MKNRFTTLDVMAVVHDLRELLGMRIQNIYDMDHKTYLLKLQKPDQKAMILFESGMRIHRTWHDWDKSQFPSSFSMKLRKHVKQLRLTSVQQVGVDRVIDLAFGDVERAVHIIVELYDRGNILLCDHEYTILNILRPRTDKDNDVKLCVKEKFPMGLAKQDDTLPTREALAEALNSAKEGDNLRRLLAPMVQFGGPLIDHILTEQGFPQKAQIKISVHNDAETLDKISAALVEGEKIYREIKTAKCKGYLSYKEEKRTDGSLLETYQDYLPFLSSQYKSGLYREFDSFSEAVDEFYSKAENQKQQQRALHVEREAFKKVDNVKKDQEARIQALVESEERQKLIAERIIMNEDKVERALFVMRTAIANKMTWEAIEEMRKKAADAGDQVAGSITKLQLDRNQFVMKLKDPYDDDEPAIEAAIDIDVNAFQNSRNYFCDKKAAAEKAKKTIDNAGIAIKNAQIRAKETLDKVRIKADVAKQRKAMWFEKFLWFVSSENYIIVAGRDAQQNELLVKRYLRPGDIYVHADLRGASSVVIRNKTGGGEVPPKTLTEAAQMAVCYSNAWEAGVVASAWWVRHDQVTRTAPTGEYLAAGSFMIRGKKNFMPASQLVMGFGLMFRVDEESAERHKDERKMIDVSSTAAPSEIGDESQVGEEEELPIDEDEEGKEQDDEQQVENEDEFPDVQVNVQTLRISRSMEEEEYSIIEIGPKIVPPGQRKKLQTKDEKKREETKKYLENKEQEERKAAASAKIAKYQKRKAQKIKKKYGDADEEEREMRMMLLASRRNQSTSDSKEKEGENQEKPKFERPPKEEKENEQKPEPTKSNKRDSDEEDDGEQPEEHNKETVEDSEAFLNQLTGRPHDDDTILYAVPMVGPYQVFNNFKYKVKLTKGSGKRGKAAKSALELFLRLKPNPQEEAHIRALVGDDANARNIPGKVRVSAPQLFQK